MDDLDYYLKLLDGTDQEQRRCVFVGIAETLAASDLPDEVVGRRMRLLVAAMRESGGRS